MLDLVRLKSTPAADRLVQPSGGNRVSRLPALPRRIATPGCYRFSGEMPLDTHSPVPGIRWGICIKFFLAAVFCCLFLPSLKAQDLSRSRFLKHLKVLSSDDFEGRGNGTPGLEKAALYIEQQFGQIGLQAPYLGGYGQDFEVPTGFNIGPENTVTFFESPDQPLRLRFGEDYHPISYQEASTDQAASMVFVGFGISAPEYEYDDYSNLDVRGKVVVAYEHEPQEHSLDSPFYGNRLTPYGTVEKKAEEARLRGALALILLPDHFNHYHDPGNLPSGDLKNLDLNVIRLSRKWGDRLIEFAGRDAAQIRKGINRDLEPQSFVMSSMQAAVHIDVTVIRKPVKNIVGILPGRKSQALIIGAHYDHLGRGGLYSLAPEQNGVVHNGADDNASGVSGLLELARYFAGRENQHTLVFVAFAGEELGLLGSRHYTDHPVVPLSQTLAMLNMDMIGRSKGELLVGGLGTAVGFRSILEDIQQGSRLRFRLAETPRAPSDHMSFAHRRIPVLFFFSGLHPDYHRPSDDWDRIEIEWALEILRDVRICLERLDESADQLVYVDLDGDDDPGSGSRN